MIAAPTVACGPEDTCADLADDGLTSGDHVSLTRTTSAKHERTAACPDVCGRFKRANEFFHGAGIRPPQHHGEPADDDYDKLPRFSNARLQKLHVQLPLTSLASSTSASATADW